jgi:hypothetical protein
LNLISQHKKKNILQLASLLCFLLIKGIFPSGFMPGSFANGNPFVLCHDDLRNGALFELLALNQHPRAAQNSITQPEQHMHHAQTDMVAEVDIGHSLNSNAAHHEYPDGNCEFANTLAKGLISFSIDLINKPFLPSQINITSTRMWSDIAYSRPPSRAPPFSIPV